MAKHMMKLRDERAMVEEARDGDRPAFDDLYRRQAAVAWRLALAVARDRQAAAGAVAQGFAAVLAGSHPVPVGRVLRPHLLAEVRRSVIDGTAAAEPAPAVTDPAATADPAGGEVGAAFAALPELWRSVLWLVEVEDLPPAEVGLALDLSTEAIAPLVARARAGLHDQLIGLRIDALDDDACRRVAERLTGYTADRLSARDEQRVRSHLDGCRACRELLAEIDDLTPILRGLGSFLPAAVATAAADRWSATLAREAGPLRLRLPGGRPVPAWAERAMAGATAAAVALGIASAVLVAGRDGQGSDGGLTRQSASGSPLDVADGESALGLGQATPDFPALGHLDLAEGHAVTVPRGLGGATGPAAGSTPSGPVPTAPGASASPSVTPPGGTDAPSGPTPSPSPGPSAPPATPVPPTTAPPAPVPGGSAGLGAVTDIVEGLGGAVGGLVGGVIGTGAPDCSGVPLVGSVLGCVPATGTEEASEPLLGGLLGGLGL